MKQYIWTLLTFIILMANGLAHATSEDLDILERVSRDLDYYYKEFSGISRSVGPSSEGQKIQTLLYSIVLLKQELWLAQKLILILDAVQSEEDKAVLKFMIRENFDEIMDHVKNTIQQINVELNVMERQSLVNHKEEFVQFLHVYEEGLSYVKSRL